MQLVMLMRVIDRALQSPRKASDNVNRCEKEMGKDVRRAVVRLELNI